MLNGYYKKTKERLQKNKKHQYRHEPYKIFVKMKSKD